MGSSNALELAPLSLSSGLAIFVGAYLSWKTAKRTAEVLLVFGFPCNSQTNASKPEMFVTVGDSPRFANSAMYDFSINFSGRTFPFRSHAW